MWHILQRIIIYNLSVNPEINFLRIYLRLKQLVCQLSGICPHQIYFIKISVLGVKQKRGGGNMVICLSNTYEKKFHMDGKKIHIFWVASKRDQIFAEASMYGIRHIKKGLPSVG